MRREAHAAEAGVAGFESALLRARRVGRRGDDDAAEGDAPGGDGAAAAAMPSSQMAAALRSETPSLAVSMSGATSDTANAATASAAAASSLHLQPTAATEPAGRWTLRLLDPTLPVQQLELQRQPAGTLQLVVGTAAPEALRGAPAERLRQRLAERGRPVSVAVGVHAADDSEADAP